MEELQRTKLNTFKIEDSIIQDDITLENAEKNIIKIEKVFKENEIELIISQTNTIMQFLIKTLS